MSLPDSYDCDRLRALPPPVEVAVRCASLPGFVFFDSAEGAATAGSPRYSLLAAQPVEVIRGDDEAAWARLEAALAARAPVCVEPSASCTGIPGSGFAAGWVEYEGALCFGFYEGALVYRHAASGTGGTWQIAGNPAAVEPLLRALEQLPAEVVAPPPIHFHAALSREGYMAAVEQAQQFIAAGDIYQVNLTHRFAAPWQAEWSSFAFYQRLRQVSPVPYAAYLAQGGRAVLSSSPELFLKIAGRQISTRPIKGTRPRGGTEAEDRERERELVTSQKEAAELVMITDLERNDLGQVCEYGSVQVSELLKLERYPQVFHLVSTVEGRLREEISAVAALRACFPGGSITGAPKKRARQIIADLEREPRGLYTGAIGYFGFDGQAQFNIAIRTVVIEGGEAHFHVGAGIVADSQPAAEWEETLHKARGILLAAQA